MASCICRPRAKVQIRTRAASGCSVSSELPCAGPGRSLTRGFDLEHDLSQHDSTTLAAALLERCAGGDEQALSSLYEMTAPRLFAVLVRILGRRELAEEALQDVFISVWRNAAGYRPEQASPLTWMISIARYRAIDLRRRARRELLLGDAEPPEDVADPGADPLTDAIRETAAAALDECLSRLRREPRTCLQLAYLNGFTHEQIAASVGQPLGTVKSWIRRGMQALKECLQR